jgi:predicted RNA-binding Zn-ribbon protein involved in translation (DUF1610 family)
MSPVSLSCPECGGERAFFKIPDLAIRFRLLMPISIYGLTCLECGYITLRVHPDDLKLLHEAAEKSAGKISYPCPECQGERVLFRHTSMENALALRAGMTMVPLHACVCLQCGYTTERPHPKVMEALRKVAAIKYYRFL